MSETKNQAAVDSYDLAVNAIEMVRFYRQYYASGREFQERLAEIATILRASSKHRAMFEADMFGTALLRTLAEALESANRPGGS